MKKYMAILILSLTILTAIALAGIHSDASSAIDADGRLSVPGFVIIANQAKLDS